MSTNNSAGKWPIFSFVADTRMIWFLPNYPFVKVPKMCSLALTYSELQAVVASAQALLTWARAYEGVLVR